MNEWNQTDGMAPEYGGFAIEASQNERAAFIRKTYLHLGGAVAAFVGLEAAIQSMPGVEGFAQMMTTGWNWLIVLGLFIVGGMVAEKLARSAASLSTQYLGLALYVFLWAIMFIPVVYVARRFEEQLGVSIIMPSALGTLIIFGVLSLVVFITGKDFSFLRGALVMLTFGAFGLIICSVLLGFHFGLLGILAFIVLASLYILYDTSNVLHHYRTDQYVSASVALFASLALLFWYVLRLALYLYASGE